MLLVAACTDDDGADGTAVSPSPSGDTPSSTQDFVGPVDTAEEAIERVLAVIRVGGPESVADEETATAEKMTEEEAWVVVGDQSGACPWAALAPLRKVWLVRVHGRFPLPLAPGSSPVPTEATWVTLLPADGGGPQSSTIIPDGIEPGIPDDCDDRPTPDPE